MGGHRAGELRVALPRQPVGRAVAVGEGAGAIAGRHDLVDVVEQPRGLDDVPIERGPPGLDLGREEGRDLGDRARVPHEPVRGIQGQQEGGGVHAPRDRHREDGSPTVGVPPGRTATGAIGFGGRGSGTSAVSGDPAQERERPSIRRGSA